MAFDVRWNSSGIDFNGAGLFITGDSPSFTIRWGEGPPEGVDADIDTDGDGTADSVDIFHFFGSDGNYDIAVDQFQNPGAPTFRLAAYMHTSETSDTFFNTTFLRDMVLTGSGNDVINTRAADDWADGGAGNDRINGGTGNDLLLGAAGEDTLLGDLGFDLLVGGDGNDTLRGMDDSDFLYGDADKDRLFGDAGDDYLNGGAGADRLTGGAGSDTFVFAPIDGAGGERDTIIDFTQGSDVMQVSDWGSMAFIGDARFSGTAAELRVVRAEGATIVLGDADGDAIADFSIRIEGAGGITIAASDFLF